MTTFSPSDAAFSGFRVIREKPRVVLAWAAVIFLFELVYGGLLVGLGGSQLTMIRAMEQTNQTDPAAALAMLPSVGIASLVSLMGWLGIAAVMSAAAYRIWLEPQDNRAAFLRLGADEFRMAVLIVLWVALAIGYGFLDLFVCVLIGALSMGLPSLLSFAFLGIVFAAGACAMIYPLMRLAFSMPMTLNDQHLRLLESWKATRGLFWPILSACGLSLVLVLVLWIVLWALVAVFAAVFAVASGLSLDNLSGLFSPDTTSLAKFFVPTTVIAALLNAFSLAAGLVILTSPVGMAYLAFVDRHAHTHPAPPPAVAPSAA
jgi:hypothetical protein